MGRLENKVAIITGAGAGLGESMAKLFSQEGAAVAIIGRTSSNIQKVAQEIVEAGGVAEAWKLDVSDVKEIGPVFKAINEKFGKIDILVNSAGIIGTTKKVYECSEEEYDKVMNVDVKGSFFCTKEVVPYMKKNGKGSIINISSIFSILAFDGGAPYHLAKGAVNQLTVNSAVSLAEDNIRVNAVLPGTSLTQLVVGHGAKLMGSTENFLNTVTQAIPMKKANDPIDVAYAALYFASDESRTTTATLLPVDGGQMVTA